MCNVKRYTIALNVNGKIYRHIITEERGILIDRNLEDVIISEGIGKEKFIKDDFNNYDSYRMRLDDSRDIVLTYNRRSLEYFILPSEKKRLPVLLSLKIKVRSIAA